MKPLNKETKPSLFSSQIILFFVFFISLFAVISLLCFCLLKQKKLRFQILLFTMAKWSSFRTLTENKSIYYPFPYILVLCQIKLNLVTIWWLLLLYFLQAPVIDIQILQKVNGLNTDFQGRPAIFMWKISASFLLSLILIDWLD